MNRSDEHLSLTLLASDSYPQSIANKSCMQWEKKTFNLVIVNIT